MSSQLSAHATTAQTAITRISVSRCSTLPAHRGSASAEKCSTSFSTDIATLPSLIKGEPAQPVSPSEPARPFHASPLRYSPYDNRGPHVFRLAEKWKGFLSLHERRRRNPLQGACHAPGHRGLAAVRAEPLGMCGLVSEGRARSIGEGLSRRSTLTIRDRRPLSAQNRPSKRSAGTAATALHEGPVAPVPDLLALAV